jgi:hypothetical protein
MISEGEETDVSGAWTQAKSIFSFLYSFGSTISSFRSQPLFHGELDAMFVEAVDQRSLAESCSGSVDSSPGNGWEVKETRGTTGVQSNY